MLHEHKWSTLDRRSHGSSYCSLCLPPCGHTAPAPGRGSSTHEDLRPTSGRKEHQVPNLRLLMNPSQWPLPLGFLSTFGHFRLTLRHTSLDVVEDDSDSSLNESELTRSTTAAEVSAASSLMREVLQPRSIRTKCASCHLRQHVQKLDSRWHNQVPAV